MRGNYNIIQLRLRTTRDFGETGRSSASTALHALGFPFMPIKITFESVNPCVYTFLWMSKRLAVKCHRESFSETTSFVGQVQHFDSFFWVDLCMRKICMMSDTLQSSMPPVQGYQKSCLSAGHSLVSVLVVMGHQSVFITAPVPTVQLIG